MFAIACRPESASPPDRLLLLPLENLTGDAGLDWQAPVSTAVLDYDLSAAPNLTVLRGESVGSIAGASANRVLQGYISRDRDKLSVHATLESSPGARTLKVIAIEGPLREGVTPLLDRAAKHIRQEARRFCTRDQAALHTYADGLGASDPSIRTGLLQTATTQDPKFSAAYIALANTLLEINKSAQAAEAAGAGVQTATDPIDRAQLQYLASLGGGDLAARERALRSLVSLLPTNTGALSQLAQLLTLERKYREAIASYDGLSKLDPRNPDPYNQIGYLYAYLRDLNGARASIRRYRELVGPADPNPSDSLGEVNFLVGEFRASAEAFLDAYSKNPSTSRELFKAAQTRLLAGDAGTADRLFQQFLGTVNKNLAELQRAQWDFMSGRPKQGIDRIQASRSGLTGDDAALATAQLAIWILQTGDRNQAAKLAAEASARSVSRPMKNLAALCSFLTSPTPGATPLPLFNGLALMLGGHYSQAIPLLKKILSETPPGQDGEVRTWLAWCYWKAGEPASAKPLVDLYPLFFPGPDSIFASLTYPRFMEVRAAVTH